MWERIRRLSLTQWILIGMGVGVVVGWAAPDVAQELRPLSTVFLRMIKSIIAPILFATLVIGIAGHGDDLRRIVAFVMPTGYSFNLDGTTLYLAVASVFAAQAAGIDLTLGQQLVMMLTLMITSKGVAAVPRASLVILSGTLAMFGLPLEAVALILGVDELMDMARTTVNLVGNCLATCVIARWEGEFGTVGALAGSAARGLPDIRPPSPVIVHG